MTVSSKPREIHKSTFEQYEPSYLVCDCGEEISFNAKFCSSCGDKIDRTEIDKADENIIGLDSIETGRPSENEISMESIKVNRKAIR